MTGLFMNFFYRSGVINLRIIEPLIGRRIDFFSDVRYFRSIVILTDIWKSIGWGAIIYLAALSGINPELYESATIDGASRLQQVFYITLPGIAHVITITLILRMGGILNAGFEQIFMFLNPLVYEVGDIIDTYVYRVGLVQRQYSYSTAVGLFKGVVGMLMVITVNQISKRIKQEGIW
jgi:putative aldouronate transport system permease protein